jgi:hypothetical protein
MNSRLNQLNKAYTKRFKQLNKNILITDNSGLLIFVEHLKYLRDTYIITQKSVETIASLNTAIEEFDAYVKNQKEFHWNNFCEFVKLNMKEWLAANDSV